jgi:hypothetical protein
MAGGSWGTRVLTAGGPARRSPISDRVTTPARAAASAVLRRAKYEEGYESTHGGAEAGTRVLTAGEEDGGWKGPAHLQPPLLDGELGVRRGDLRVRLAHLRLQAPQHETRTVFEYPSSTPLSTVREYPFEYRP